MLLSPINSPDRYHAFLRRPLPLLIHESIDNSFECDITSQYDSEQDTDDIEQHHLNAPIPLSSLSHISYELVLPVELIYYIVELASSHRRTAVALCRVASWIRAAVLPTLYNTIICDVPSSSGKVTTECPVQQHNPIRAVPSSFYDVRQSGLPSPLKYVRALWLDVEPKLAPYTLDFCPRLTQLALRLESYATITRSSRWREQDSLLIDSPGGDSSLGLTFGSICRSFTVLGQSHPHRWVPLTSSEAGRTFLKDITHLRLLNLCLSHYSTSYRSPFLTFSSPYE